MKSWQGLPPARVRHACDYIEAALAGQGLPVQAIYAGWDGEVEHILLPIHLSDEWADRLALVTGAQVEIRNRAVPHECAVYLRW